MRNVKSSKRGIKIEINVFQKIETEEKKMRKKRRKQIMVIFSNKDINTR